MEKTTVVLADDQVLFLESLRSVLETRGDNLVVAGTARDGEEAVRLVEKVRPDVVLMDVRMPRMDGVEATRRILASFPETHIIMLTTFDNDDYVHSALKLGAAGYLLKDMPPEELITFIRAVKKGTVLISPAVARKLAEQADGHDHELDPPEWLLSLSPRERQIFRFLAQGQSNREIGEALGIAEQTVKNHISVIYSKLGVHDRFHALKKAVDSNVDLD